MNTLISMFIDDEMNMDDKTVFVETVRTDESFAGETLVLLSQEKILRGEIVTHHPRVEVKAPFYRKRSFKRFFKPLGIAASALATVVIFFIYFMPPPASDLQSNRFVIYRPDVSKIEITGTFTGWKRIPMTKIGSSGYWEIFFALSDGEHRFTYILEGREPFTDPTIPARETDDFGGQNSILFVEKRV